MGGLHPGRGRDHAHGLYHCSETPTSITGTRARDRVSTQTSAASTRHGTERRGQRRGQDDDGRGDHAGATGRRPQGREAGGVQQVPLEVGEVVHGLGTHDHERHDQGNHQGDRASPHVGPHDAVGEAREQALDDDRRQAHQDAVPGDRERVDEQGHQPCGHVHVALVGAQQGRPGTRDVRPAGGRPGRPRPRARRGRRRPAAPGHQHHRVEPAPPRPRPGPGGGPPAYDGDQPRAPRRGRVSHLRVGRARPPRSPTG